MNTSIRRLHGANMDIDLATPQDAITWQQDACPWNAANSAASAESAANANSAASAEGAHRCAVKSVSICPYFCGVDYLDTLLCCYPEENPLRQ